MPQKILASIISLTFISSLFFVEGRLVFAQTGATSASGIGGGGISSGASSGGGITAGSNGGTGATSASGIGQGNFAGKPSIGSLVPIAQMRDPQAESKDLDSCISGLLGMAGSVVGGLLGTAGGAVGGAVGSAVSGIAGQAVGGAVSSVAGSAIGGIAGSAAGSLVGGALGAITGGGGGCSWDSIAWMAAKALIGVEFQGMTNMAQTGFFGEQAWIDNPDQYYSSINSEVTDNFFNTEYEQASGVPQSIKDSVRERIMREQTMPFGEKISQGVSFPGGDSGYQQYLENGTCSTGNSLDCYEAAMSSNNDPFMVEEATRKRLAEIQISAHENVKNEVLAGNGFRDTKEGCEVGHYVGCISVTPGSITYEQTNKALMSSVDQLQAADELDETLAAGVQGLYKIIIGFLNGQGLSALGKNLDSVYKGIGTFNSQQSGARTQKTTTGTINTSSTNSTQQTGATSATGISTPKPEIQTNGAISATGIQ